MAGSYENENEWTMISGMRHDAKIWTEEDGGSGEIAELRLESTEAAGGVPEDAAMRLFFEYAGSYHR